VVPVSRAERVGAVAAVLAAALVTGAARAIPDVRPPSRDSAWVARLVRRVAALSGPGRGRVVRRESPFAPANGGPVSLLVLGSRVGVEGRLWLSVLLPVRPNGTTGWIPADGVELRATAWRIEISTERRTLTLLHQGERVRVFRVVVGAPATPTPHGLFAIYERVKLAHADGFLGGWALHLTAFSDVLRRFEGGPGRVAIHGRGGASLRDPLGSARSHGCVRMDNDAVRLLAARVPEGTPVLID
jgi:lipoprotein-anchoring transpeptidase ErfK/SrfK